MYQHLRSSVRRLAKSFAKKAHNRNQELRNRVRRETLALEPLEARRVMVNPSVTLLDANNAAIVDNATIQVKAGSPLWIPLDGSDADGGALTYTVTSSNTNVVSVAKTPSTDKWVRITVQNFGSMLFHLFDSEVPRVTGHFEELSAADGYYNVPTNTSNSSQFDNFDNTIHRIIQNFVIQGGDRQTGSGSGGSPLGNFDDQFSLDLQHNRIGMLSYAKTSDDTNDSQFFITNAVSSQLRNLDFNHSIFGTLVEGESVRAQIAAVPVDANDKPTTPVKITSIEILDGTDEGATQNGVFLLKAPSGVSSGTSQITVVATDAQGHPTTRTFNVQVVADDSNGSPFLPEIVNSPIVAQAGAAKTVSVVASDAENDAALTYTVSNVSSSDVQVVVSQTGQLTITPSATAAGQYTFTLNVRQTSPTANTTDSTGDSQTVTINVDPAAPALPDLVDSSDSGPSNSDNVTNATTLSFVVSGVKTGATVKLFAGSQEIGTATVSSGTSVTMNVDTNAISLASGTYVVTAKQIVGSLTSAASTGLNLTFDTQIADFPTIPTLNAEGNVPFSFDVEHPDEDQSGFKYELTNNPPAGLTINQSTGVMTWTPPPTVGSHSFKVKATDAAGNIKEQDVTINITAVRLAQFQVIATDLNGTPITSIQKGQEFFLLAQIKDLRSGATGIDKAFFDVAFDTQLASVVSGAAVEHLGSFTTDASGSVTTTSGEIINEAGGKSTASTGDGTVTSLFRIKLKADKTGTLALTPNIAEDAAHASSARALTGSGSVALDGSNLLFTAGSLEIEANFTLQDETFNVNEDSTNSSLDVLRNAVKPTGEVLTIDSLGTPNHGGVVTINDNKVVYTPAHNFFGEETFTYTVKNSAGDTRTATVTVEVANVNDPPTATDDTATTTEDSGFISIDVLANDQFSPDPTETLTIKPNSVSAGSHGGQLEVDSTSNVIRYKPAANFNGTETFTYIVQDGHGGEDTATVTVTVTPANDNPTATDDTIQVSQDVTDKVLDVLTNDKIEPDTGETLTITSKTNPSHGTLKLEGGQLKYTPTPGFRGADSFTYTISDGNGGTATATVHLQVANSNVPPNANDDVATTKKNVSIEIDVLKNDNVGADVGETLTITAVTQPPHGKTTIVNGKIKYEPTAGFTGTDTFSYTITDTVGTTDTATVTVTVNPIAPSDVDGFVFLDLNQNGRKDANESAISGVLITLTGKDSAGATVNKTAVTDMAGHYQIVDIEPGDYTIKESSPAFLIDGQALPGSKGTAKNSNEITLKIDAEGTHIGNTNFTELGREAFTFRLFELFGSTSRNSVTTAMAAGGTSSWVQLGGTQWSTFQKVSVKLASDLKSATIDATNAAGTKLRSTVPVSPTGLARIISSSQNNHLLKLFGGPGAFNLQGVANVAPSFTKITNANQTALEDAPKVTVANWAANIKKGADDETNQTLTFVVTSDKPELFEEQPAISETGTLTFKPKANANGTANVKVTLKDSGGTAFGGDDTSDEQTFTVTITAVNDAPSFTAGANQTVAEDAGAQSVTGWATALSKGPADEAGQTLTFTVTTDNPNLFAVPPAIDADGKLTYTPKPNGSGTATVTVRLKDSGGIASGGDDESDAKTFTITITGSNDPPVAGADSTTTTEGVAKTINVLSNDSDPDGDALTVNTTLITPPTAAMGTAMVNSDKTITFTPATDFSGTATFTYQLEDGKGGIASGTVTITVTNVNDVPNAVDDTASTTEDAQVEIELLQNDTDADNDTLTVTITDEPAHGTLSTPSEEGIVTYTPAADFNGTDTFTYSVSDGHGGTDTATVTITVAAKNDAPSFDAGGNEAVDQDSGAQSVPDWATNISAGPDNESSQTLTFEIVNNTNPNLFDEAPAISSDGTLTYTPKAGQTGTATITVHLKDSGGTANGGVDTSGEATFTITVNAPGIPTPGGVDEFMSSL